ncbi:substrate-binding periplasmic protein, partial [Pseudomonas aeruginosa]
EQLIAEAHLERSGQTRTLAVDPLTGQADQQRSPGQEQDQGQHAPLQPAWREDPLGMR